MRANATMVVGLFLFFAGAILAVERSTWHWLLYGFFACFLAWSTVSIYPPKPTTCQYCGREES